MGLDIQALNKQYIDGVWRDGQSGKVYLDQNPYDDSVVAEFRMASVEDVDLAYRAAERAQLAWAKVNPFEKRDLFERVVRIIDENTEDIVRWIAEEIGGTFVKAMIEVMLVKNTLREAATYPLRMEGRILPSTIPGKENRLLRLPVGVVGVISPFNFPFCLSMRAVAPALACGNGVVLKPNEASAIVGGTLIAKLFEEAGLPKGVLNVIVTEIGQIGDAFIEHPVPRVISFTGSTPVGRHIGEVASRHLKRVALELGGNSALIVLDDANLEQAVDATVFSRFTHQGQICMCANRAIVQRAVYDEFVARLVDRVASLQCGNPLDKDTVIGPLIHRRQVDAVLRVVEESVAQGAKVAYRGPVEGNVVGPIVLTDVTEEMACARQEMFGPVLAVIPVDSEEEAIRIANHSDFGLSGAVHTQSVERGVAVAMRIESGMVHVNDGTVNDEPLVAFGGEKASGIGRYNGEWALEEFTTVKWISIQHERRSYPI
ncbi:putative aldehyde dehydrogenase YfmT [Alicyclobacillus contaminans]|uniref:aldehyde dehydrogenase family protein n=1 Tax=Alicyclobacillus contaminans TaxID=392016 RepID=UPI0003F69811|nr:aldehyde dehydrogenase family protein [Alicyclobacillus contaminans]GMA49712.1 putative aldehyde dehydrogenase YfmT [Alicyclobacillus contaminans]